MRVCHVTSAHARYDIRIFKKMCQSLARNGIETTLVVADGNGDEVSNGVTIVDAGAGRSNRLNRMTKVVYKVFKKTLDVEADIYHLHDPELMFTGILLRIRGYRVIFDAHEDLPKQLRSKPYLNSIFRFILPVIFRSLEHVCFRFFSGLIGATPKISDKLSRSNNVCETVNNYPILGELSSQNSSIRTLDVCYLGGISEIRGVRQMVSCLSYLDKTELLLAGAFNSDALENEMKSEPGWERVRYLGQIERFHAADLLSTSLAGLVLFHSAPNHIEAQPNKLFEYMSAGLPVISSNFDLWKEIIETNRCGICVDPMDSAEIAGAISYLIANPAKAKEMGDNGLKAVRSRYNWGEEERKLLSFYAKVLGI